VSQPKSTTNTGEPWSDSDVQQLRELIDGNTPTRLIGHKLGRTEDAVPDKTLELSLATANRPPYGDMS
jgi:hypothetical protein